MQAKYRARKGAHQDIVLTKRHALRMRDATGRRVTGKPSDYAIDKSEEGIRLRDARRRIEDYEIVKEMIDFFSLMD